MKKSNVCKLVFGLLLLIGTSIVPPPSVAYAAQCSRHPGSGWLYLYEHTHYAVKNGRCLQFRNGGVQNLPEYHFNDALSSLKNRTGYTVYLYWDWKGKGYKLSVPPGDKPTMPPGWNDQVSSICIKKPGANCP